MHLIARMHLLCVLCFCYLLSIYYVWRQSSAGLSYKFGICIYKGLGWKAFKSMTAVTYVSMTFVPDSRRGEGIKWDHKGVGGRVPL